MKKYRYPCCGYYTFDEPIENTFNICPVCFWEDDGVQLFKCDYSGGANSSSLYKARANFKEFGACEQRLIKYVRDPKENELSGIDWAVNGDKIEFSE